MSNAFELLAQLSRRDMGWLLDCGEEVKLETGDVLIEQGREVEHFYVLVDGLVGVQVEGKEVIMHRGPGELLGDLSFLLGTPASATVMATEATRLLAIPKDKMVAKMVKETPFAAQIYRAFAIVNARRVQSIHGGGGKGHPPPTKPSPTGLRACIKPRASPSPCAPAPLCSAQPASSRASLPPPTGSLKTA